MEETSLDDFRQSDGTATADPEPGGDVVEERDVATDEEGNPVNPRGEAAGSPDRAGDEPAETPHDVEAGAPTVTATWSATETACAECGEPSDWRWAQDGDMVCPDCKDW